MFSIQLINKYTYLSDNSTNFTFTFAIFQERFLVIFLTRDVINNSCYTCKKAESRLGSPVFPRTQLRQGVG